MITLENQELKSSFFTKRKIIAIDPGKQGGIAVYSIEDDEVIALVSMPETMQDVLRFISLFQRNSVCYLEKVGGLPGMGGSSMFNFGRGFGHLEMALMCRNIPTTEVTPQKWQKELQLGNKGNKTTNEWKTKLKERAQQLFPSVGSKFNIKTKTDWMTISDALLILEYAKIKERGSI